MKRSGLKRRTALQRTGRLRPKRKKPGVTGRLSAATPEVWRALKEQLWVRARGRCEVPECRSANPPLDPHHVIKRSQGGQDSLQNLVCLCRRHHDQTDAPFDKGKLVVKMVEDGVAGTWRPTFHVASVKSSPTATSARASRVARSGGDGGTSRAAGRFRRGSEWGRAL